jgi:Acyltransferase family
MTSALSLYLDGLRFGAAFMVFLSHYAVGRISGALFWQAATYGRTAVLLFFVLSGFVIAWVTETRERTPGDYGLSRVARLYSVIIPAFLLTAVLNCVGSEIDPSLYGPEWGHGTNHPIIGYALSAMFLGESWKLGRACRGPYRPARLRPHCPPRRTWPFQRHRGIGAARSRGQADRPLAMPFRG